MTITINEQLLEEKLVTIEKVRSWSPRVVSKLENTIRSGSDDELFRVNPIEWAAQKQVDEHEAIALFLHSAKIGLFNMDWNVICPCCGAVLHSLRDLHSVKSRNLCTICMREESSTLDDYVQISFTLSRVVRQLKFHQPETLSPEDYYFTYVMSRNARFYAPANLSVGEMLESTVRHLSLFNNGDRVAVEIDMHGVGAAFCNNVFTREGIALFFSGPQASEVQTLPVRLTDEGFDVPLQALDPGEFMLGDRQLRGQMYLLQPGKVVLEIEHTAASKAALLVQAMSISNIQALTGIDLTNSSKQTDGLDVNFGPCLTAKQLFACQTFHDLFRSEVFQESQGFSVKDVTVMFTDLKSSTQLYNQIGDLNAFALVREHYGVLNKSIIDNHGAVVKTIGDAIMATFAEPSDATCAGLEMLQGLREMNSGSQYGDLALKIGIHRGAAISVTLNERIDYFGQMINTASRIQGVAGGDEIYITDDIYSAAGVADLVAAHHCNIETMSLELKGIDEHVKVFKLTGISQG